MENSLINGFSKIHQSKIKLAAVLLGAIILPQINSIGFLGLILWILIGFISYSEAELSILFLILSQILPEIPDIPVNLAQWAIIIWLVYRILSNRKVKLEIAFPIVITVFPLLIWLGIAGIMRSDIPFFFAELIKGTIYIFIVYDSVQGRKFNWNTIIEIIIVGCLFAVIPFWMGDTSAYNDQIGFDGGNRGYIRVGSWRGNANFLMVVVCFSLIGNIHRWFQAQFSSIKPRFSSWFFFIIVCILSIPPLIGTQSRTFYITSLVMVLLIIIFEWPIIKKNRKWTRLGINIIGGVLLLVIFLNVLLPSWHSRIATLFEYQANTGMLIEGRSSVWLPGIKALIDKPIFGIGMDEFSSAYAKGALTSHNTYLDSGIMGGILGILLTIVFFGCPFILVKRNSADKNFRILFILYITGLILANSIAFQGLKIIYILWGLLFSFAFYKKKKVTSH